MIRMQTIGSSDTDDQMGSFQNSNKLADFGDDLFSSSSEQQLRQQQQQAQISMENDVNLTQLREREAALRKLESDITDVNTIFKDLAVMVHDQGEIIDSIESNVEQVHVRVSEANNHLESARKNQVSYLTD
jgi:syntaxin 12/13